jgi:hypothetical protein
MTHYHDKFREKPADFVDQLDFLCGQRDTRAGYADIDKNGYA